jgi:hypothetical protein
MSPFPGSAEDAFAWYSVNTPTHGRVVSCVVLTQRANMGIQASRFGLLGCPRGIFSRRGRVAAAGRGYHIPSSLACAR